jgi:class 3 adenylate cyclase
MLDAAAAAGWLPRLLDERPGGDPAATAARFDAAVLWLDVSGFTALSELLAERGPAGAERLSELLNERFGALIEVIARHGGDITHFAGDAICAVWPVAAGRPLGRGLTRAARAALALQALPDDPGRREGEPPLRVRAGVAAGACAWTLLGGDDEGFFVVGGAPPAQAAAAAAAGQPGEVVVVAAAWPLLPGAVAGGEPTPAGDLRLRALEAAGDDSAVEAPGAAAPDPATVARFLPRMLRERLAVSGGWLAEFRRVTVLFVGFGDGDFADPAQHDAAGTQVAALQAVVARFDGTVHQLVAEERGATLIAAWGLAGVTHEDDARRGVEAALAIAAELARLGVPAAVGVASGRLFCGVRGSAARREWAIVGDRMNLAARLMRAAGSGVLCDDTTALAAAARLRFEALAPVALKGKARPVPVFRPLGGAAPGSRASASVQALVGRDAEGARFDAWLGDGGRGGAWLVEGEAGIGKSALVADLARRAAARGIAVLRGEGDPVESATAYFAWRGLLRTLLAPDEHGDARPAIAALLAGDSAAQERVALLDDVLELGLPETPATAAMEPLGRADALRDLVGTLLRRAAERRPLLVVVDDAHCLDSASWALLAAATRRAPAVAFVVALRPLPEPLPAGLRQLLDGGATRLALAPLPPGDVLRLACTRLGVESLPRAAEALIVERAQGNPFFGEQLALALRDAGHLVAEGGRCRLARPEADLAALAVPDTVQGVVGGRIDRLRGDEQLTLKVAAVIGRVFGERVLGDVHPAAPAAPVLGGQLERLQRLDFTRPEAPEPEPTHLFTHAITQQVAYDLMIYAQRRQMHRAIAQWFEQRFGDALDPHLPLLAHHWAQAGDAVRAVPYLERAAAQALGRFANAEVLRFVAQALALADQGRLEVGPEQRARWSWYQGEALLKLARYAESRTHFVDALRRLGHPVPASRARLLAVLAAQLLRQWRQRLRGGARPAAQAEHDALRLAAHLHQRLAEVGYWEHDIVTLLHSAVASLNLAERAGASRQLQLAYHVFGFVAGLAGSAALQRRYTGRAGALAAQVGHVETDAFGAQLDAIYFNGQARWGDMEAAALRAGHLFERIGERFRWQTCVVLRAWGALHRGDDAGALALFRDALQMVGSEGPTQVQVWGNAGLVAVALARGRLGEAGDAARLERLLAHGVDHSDAILCHGLLALAHARAGEDAAAQRHAERAAALIDRWPPASFHTLLGSACVEQLRRRASQRSGSRADRAEHRRALRGLRRFAAVCPIGAPFLWRARAAQALVEGRPARAERCRQRAEAEGRRLGMNWLPGWEAPLPGDAAAR